MQFRIRPDCARTIEGDGGPIHYAFRCAFSDDYPARFLMNSCTAQGDRKRALASLRTTHSQKTHHFSSFRTGMALGLAFPAFVDGIIHSTSSAFFHTATETL